MLVDSLARVVVGLVEVPVEPFVAAVEPVEPFVVEVVFAGLVSSPGSLEGL